MTVVESKMVAAVAKINVLGVGIASINLPMAASLIFDAIARHEKGYICVTDVHVVMQARRDEAFRKVLNSAFLCTPDGMPIVWMTRLQGHSDVSRVYGPDLMQAVLQKSVSLGIRHFLYGGHGGSGLLLQQKLLQRFPGLQIVGVFEPPFRPLNPEEENALTVQVKQSHPDIIWVGIGAPKQELFMAKHLQRLDTVLMVGVGAAFDLFSGLKPQAPLWMQRNGLEWFFRLCQEPRRLLPRYLRNNPAFLWHATLQLFRLKNYPIEKA